MYRGVGFLLNLFSSRCSRLKTLLLRLGETARISSKLCIIERYAFLDLSYYLFFCRTQIISITGSMHNHHRSLEKAHITPAGKQTETTYQDTVDVMKCSTEIGSKQDKVGIRSLPLIRHIHRTYNSDQQFRPPKDWSSFSSYVQHMPDSL